MKAATRLVLLLGLLAIGSGCTHVRTSRRDPQTGETWTVFSHTFEDDTVSYCAPPQWGGACFEARRYSRAPDVMPSHVYTTNVPQWRPPPPPNGWGR